MSRIFFLKSILLSGGNMARSIINNLESVNFGQAMILPKCHYLSHSKTLKAYVSTIAMKALRAKIAL